MTTLTRIISIFYLNTADLSKVRTLERGARSLKSEKVHPGGGDLISARINGRQGLEEGQRRASGGTGRCQPYGKADGGPAAEGQVCPPGREKGEDR